MRRISIFEELNREKEKAEHYKKEADEWQKKYSELEKKFKELEKKFNQLLNSNTPTSKIPSYLKQYSITRPERGSNKRGKPKGGNGGSRKPPRHHDEKVEAIAESCPKCKSHSKILKQCNTKEDYWLLFHCNTWRMFICARKIQIQFLQWSMLPVH